MVAFYSAHVTPEVYLDSYVSMDIILTYLSQTVVRLSDNCNLIP